MLHVLDKHVLLRTNDLVLLTLIGGGLMACALGATAFDIVHWLGW
jgi:hypothetical protein